MDINKKLVKLDIKLNRLYSRKAACEYKEKVKKDRMRKMRTRTLIQMGGLLQFFPLFVV